MLAKAIALNLPVFKAIKLNFNLKLCLIFVFALILSLLSVCIYQFNRYTQEVYLIQTYQNKVVALTKENKSLEINFANTNSLKNINSFLAEQNFEKVSQAAYVYLLNGTALAK